MSAEPVVPASLKGVEYRDPPALILSTINRQIDEALAQLPKDSNGVFLLDVTTDRGVNAAFVRRFDGQWSLMTYVGKSWGMPVHGGVTVRKEWR